MTVMSLGCLFSFLAMTSLPGSGQLAVLRRGEHHAEIVLEAALGQSVGDAAGFPVDAAAAFDHLAGGVGQAAGIGAGDDLQVLQRRQALGLGLRLVGRRASPVTSSILLPAMPPGSLTMSTATRAPFRFSLPSSASEPVRGYSAPIFQACWACAARQHCRCHRGQENVSELHSCLLFKGFCFRDLQCRCPGGPHRKPCLPRRPAR